MAADGCRVRPSARARGQPTIHNTGSLCGLESLDFVVVAIDGGLQGSLLSWGHAVWHPRDGVFFEAWWGLLAYRASPTDAEWLAKITAMLVLPPATPLVYMVSDASAAQQLNLTRGPAPFSILNVLYRRAVIGWGLRPLKEIWLRTGHNTNSQAILTQLDRRAHDLACRGRHEAQVYAAPWLRLLHGRVAAYWPGQIVLDVSAFESMGDDYVRAVGLPPLRAPPSLPTYATFVAGFLARSVPLVALRRIYLLRLLGRRHPPSTFVAQSCPFCDAVVTDLVLYLRAACWHYVGYLVSVLGALCWHDCFRQCVLGPDGHQRIGQRCPLVSSACGPPCTQVWTAPRGSTPWCPWLQKFMAPLTTALLWLPSYWVH